MNEKWDEIQGKLDLVRVRREFEISEFEISGFYLFYFIYFICHTIITKKNCENNRASTFCRKLKAEGSVIFQNIFSLMATLLMQYRYCHAARLIKVIRIFVAVRKRLIESEKSSNLSLWLFYSHRSRDRNVKKSRCFCKLIAAKKGYTFQFNLSLLVILHILHSA